MWQSCCVLVVLVTFTACSLEHRDNVSLPEEDKGSITNDASYESERIVGGQTAQEEQFPYAAALYMDEQFICTASIISQTALLTAAHCVVFNGIQRPASAYSAVIGSVDRTAPDATSVNIRKITVHPRYQSAKENDLAILETSEPIQLSEAVKPICIASPKIGCLLLKRVIALGWGYLKEGNTTLPDDLQYVEQKVVSNLKCSALYFFTKIPKTVLCATGIRSGVCGGDSGGPLVYMSKSKQPIQVGVNAFVNNFFGCGTYFGPAGFTRVSSYTDFIMDNAPGDVCVAS